MNNPNRWFLGINFDGHYLAAVLLNIQADKPYPIYWQQPDKTITYQLPMAVYSDSARGQLLQGISAINTPKNKRGIYLERFNNYLNLTIPYYHPQQRQWQPFLPDFPLSLYSLRQFFRDFCLTLTPFNATIETDLKIGTQALSSVELALALEDLQGVIVNCSSQANESYRFNLREAILGAKLVKEASKIIFVEEAIACWLGHLCLNPDLQATQTLFIHFGSLTTELAIINCEEKIENLTVQDFCFQSWNYGENYLQQDILSQLVYPQWLSYLDYPVADLEIESFKPAVADVAKRDNLNLQLQNSDLGRSLLKAASLVQLVLQKREAFTAKVANSQWGVKRQDLHNRVIRPIIYQLNQNINQILTKNNRSEQDIYQVVCSGNYVKNLAPLLTNLIEQKFPNASLINLPNYESIDPLALGLSRIPLFPKLINSWRHQYGDYFLLIELLRTINKPVFTLEELINSLEKRGLNTRLCLPRILSLLAGNLPSGLLPSLDQLKYLNKVSQNNPDYQLLNQAPWIVKEDQETYRLDLKQLRILRQYLTLILASSQQKMKDPLIFN